MTAAPQLLTPIKPFDEDEFLLDQCRLGEVSAYERLVHKHWDRIYVRVFHLLRNHEDAEEVTQDAFIRAYRSLARFRGEASFSTWIFQIATNLAHNRYWYWRRRARQRSLSLHHPIEGTDSVQLRDILADETPDTHADVELRETSERINEVLPRLSRGHQEILDLRLRQNRSYEEIACHLGINVGTVKSRINRARESLRTLLQSDPVTA